MKLLRLILSSMVILIATQSAWADHTSRGRVQLLRDESLEQSLKWESSVNRSVTPATILRWIRGLSGQVLAAPRQTEFQPMVNTRDGHVRVVFAFAYKF